jgi:hypothetical protein
MLRIVLLKQRIQKAREQIHLIPRRNQNRKRRRPLRERRGVGCTAASTAAQMTADTDKQHRQVVNRPRLD